MAEYETRRQENLASAATTTITGLPLDIDEEKQVGGQAFSPIGTCVCVIDTPENPCPCNGPVLWFRRDDILDSSGTGRQTIDDEELQNYRIRSDAQALMEMHLPLTAEGASLLIKYGRELTEPEMAFMGEPEFSESEMAFMGEPEFSESEITFMGGPPPKTRPTRGAPRGIGGRPLIGAGVRSGPAAAVVGSFMAGHHFGTWLDEKTGLSDAIGKGLFRLLH